MFDGLSHIMLYARDVKRAAAWYTEKLGFRVLYFGGEDYAGMLHEGMKLQLHLHVSLEGGADVGHGPMPFFAAKDFDGVVARMKAAGIAVGEARTEGNSPRFLSFKDCEGNLLGLSEVKPHRHG